MCGSSFVSFNNIKPKIKDLTPEEIYNQEYEDLYLTDPKWKISKDKKHMTFYTKHDNWKDSCLGGTNWCKRHCYLKKYPLNEPVYEAQYNVKNFNPCNNRLWVRDILDSSYITFFGSGSIDVFEGELDYTLKLLHTWYPNKIFRLFIRHILEDMYSGIPENIMVNFSIDCDTKAHLINYAFTSKDVKCISIVDHKDNEFIFNNIPKKYEVISCHECKGVNYLCFKRFKKSKDKFILKLNYK